MRLRLTIALLILNAVLFGVLYILDKRPMEPPPGFEPVIPEGIADKVDRLSIEGRDLALRWVLEKRGSDWFISSPINWRANLFAVNRILNQLQFLERITSFSVQDIVKAGQSLADYGLAEPNAILALQHGGTETKIRIGSSTKVGNRLYILSHDETEVFVVNRELLDSITIDLDDLRSQLIFDIPLYEVRSVSLRLKNLPLRIVRRGDDWNFETPIEMEADNARVEAAINKLSGIRLLEFLSPDPVGQGLDSPSVRLTLEGNNRRETLLLGHRLLEDSAQPLYYASLEGNPTVFTVPSEPFVDLLKAQENLRDRYFVRISPEILNAIEITVGSESVRLQRLERGGWQVPRNEPDGALANWPADPLLIDEMISSIHETRALRFVTDSPSTTDLVDFGLEDPQRKVRLLAQDQTSVLLIGDLAGTKDTVYAKLTDHPSVYEIQSGRLLSLLQTRPLHYRLRLLAQQPSAAVIESVVLHDLEIGRDLFSLDLKADQEGQNGSIPEGVPNLGAVEEEDREPALTLLHYGREFSVNSYLKQVFTEGHDLGEKRLPWRYLLRFGILLPGGAQAQKRSLSYYFTERLGAGTQIGGSPEFEVTFSLDQNLIDALFHFSFDRSAVPVDL